MGRRNGPLTASQRAAIASDGFTLTLVARALQNGLAPDYTTSNPVVIDYALVAYANVRWEIDLGLNSHGDTVAVLPNSANLGGPGGSVRSIGANYTLTGSGSTYHTYQLLYDPTTNSADLFVDGVLRLTGYTGNTSYPQISALAGVSSAVGRAISTSCKFRPVRPWSPSQVVLCFSDSAPPACLPGLGSQEGHSVSRWALSTTPLEFVSRNSFMHKYLQFGLGSGNRDRHPLWFDARLEDRDFVGFLVRWSSDLITVGWPSADSPTPLTIRVYSEHRPRQIAVSVPADALNHYA